MYRRSMQLLFFNSPFQSNMSLITNKVDSSIQMYRRVNIISESIRSKNNNAVKINDLQTAELCYL